jgi:3-oxoacyl-[acyl-carrier-protein] synthase-1
MECAFTALALSESWKPASAHIDDPDPETQGVNILRQTEHGPYATAMSNSSGFGGANVSIIFGRA